MDCDSVKGEASRALEYLERALEVVDEVSLPACIGASIEEVIQLMRSECPEPRA